MRVAFATCRHVPGGSDDDRAASERLGASYPVWSDPDVDWGAFDRVVIRSTWDYTQRLEEFLAWCRDVGPERLRNRPDLVAWNADKRYLGDLRVPVVATAFVGPGDALPALAGEVVVKPSVSAGARDTGRFDEPRHDEARALIESIRASGRTALVQPYERSVDARGETALVYFAGALSHVLRKRPVLREPGIAPTSEDEAGVARVMLEPDLVVASSAAAAEVDLAERVLDEVGSRFGTPLYARVDLVTGEDRRPRLLELEVVEPALYLAQAPGSAARFARAVTRC